MDEELYYQYMRLKNVIELCHCSSLLHVELRKENLIYYSTLDARR